MSNFPKIASRWNGKEPDRTYLTLFPRKTPSLTMSSCTILRLLYFSLQVLVGLVVLIVLFLFMAVPPLLFVLFILITNILNVVIAALGLDPLLSQFSSDIFVPYSNESYKPWSTLAGNSILLAIRTFLFVLRTLSYVSPRLEDVAGCVVRVIFASFFSKILVLPPRCLATSLLTQFSRLLHEIFG